MVGYPEAMQDARFRPLGHKGSRRNRSAQRPDLSFSTRERQAIGFSITGEKLDMCPSELLCLQFAAAFALGSAIALLREPEEQPKEG